MKIPKKVKIGGLTYKVKQVDEINRMNDDGEITAGLIECSESMIYIKKNLEHQAKELSFLHELVHAIFYHCDIVQDEDQVEILSQALHMVIKDNPGLFESKGDK